MRLLCLILVYNLINQSKSTTCESDIWPTPLLKCMITRLLNLSLSERIFLDRWKRAIVKTLIKKTNLDTIFSNYRPINNLSFLSKILQKVVQLQLGNHIDEQKLLPDYQSSYRTTETALLKVTDDIWKAMKRQEVTSMVALDLSAAFDTVNHQILCDVLDKTICCHRECTTIDKKLS